MTSRIHRVQIMFEPNVSVDSLTAPFIQINQILHWIGNDSLPDFCCGAYIVWTTRCASICICNINRIEWIVTWFPIYIFHQINIYWHLCIWFVWNCFFFFIHIWIYVRTYESVIIPRPIHILKYQLLSFNHTIYVWRRWWMWKKRKSHKTQIAPHTEETIPKSQSFTISHSIFSVCRERLLVTVIVRPNPRQIDDHRISIFFSISPISGPWFIQYMLCKRTWLVNVCVRVVDIVGFWSRSSHQCAYLDSFFSTLFLFLSGVSGLYLCF